MPPLPNRTLLTIGAALNPKVGLPILQADVQREEDAKLKQDQIAERNREIKLGIAKTFLGNKELLAALPEQARANMAQILKDEGIDLGDLSQLNIPGETPKGSVKTINVGTDPKTNIPLIQSVVVNEAGEIVRELGPPTPKAVAQDTIEAFGAMTRSQQGKQIQDLQNAEVAVKQFDAAARDLEQSVTQQDIGIPGFLARTADSLLSQAMAIRGEQSPQVDLSLDKWRDQLGGWASQSAAVQGAIIDLAYTHALSKNARVTDADFKASLQAIGGNTGSVGQLKNSLREAARRQRMNFKIMYRTLLKKDYTGFDDIEDQDLNRQIEELQRRKQELLNGAQ